MSVTITCDCKTCRANAATLGVTAPLTATVSPLAIGTANPVSHKATGRVHGLVHLANDPSTLQVVRAAQRNILAG